MGMLRWQLFTAFPELSNQLCACLFCSDEGNVPLQGTGKLLSQLSSAQISAAPAYAVGMTLPQCFWLKLHSYLFSIKCRSLLE